MESLSLRGYSAQPGYLLRSERRRLSPRLQTPEASRTSNGSFDSTSPHILQYTELPPPPQTSLRSPECRLASLCHPVNAHSARKDSRNESIPHSPPYQTDAGQKPYLPPLKTVLGDTMSSPPTTPGIQAHQSQPSPREPSYTASVYKPPALYPNKKQRTELVLDQAAPLQSANKFRSLGLHPGPFESSAHPATHRSYRLSALDVDRPEIDRMHWSAQCSNSSYKCSRYPTTIGHGARDAVGGQRYPLYPGNACRSPEQTPTTTAIDQHSERMQMYNDAAQFRSPMPPRDMYGTRAQSHASRRSLSTDPDLLRRHDSGTGLPRRSNHVGQRYSLPLRDARLPSRDTLRYERPVDRPEPHLPHFDHEAYGHSQAAFFPPSHYEYQQDKARKRSNLPKQSTEIMKTWFDQNITNPYPSEEQKTVFSNVTGISMTQVSNWFINHRRRCPELREKRDRIRANGSRDSEG